MITEAKEATASLRRLAMAVEADRGAYLYFDRGDGVLELMASICDGEPVSPPTRPAEPVSGSSRRLRRFLTTARGGARPAGAVAHLALPDERGGLLVLERQRSEPFNDEDLALARVQARQLVRNVTTRLGHRPMAWSAQFEAVQSVAAQLTRLTSVE